MLDQNLLALAALIGGFLIPFYRENIKRGDK